MEFIPKIKYFHYNFIKTLVLVFVKLVVPFSFTNIYLQINFLYMSHKVP
jgi:hypothetical protein